MSKYVRDTSAGKSISAYVIMRGTRKVATVQASWSNGGRCLVNIWQETEAADRSAKVRAKAGNPFKSERYIYLASFQHASASGYGYDKFASALSGLIIDGHEMTDHCSRLNAPKKPKGCTLYPRDFKAPKGYSLSNFSSVSKATGRTIYRDAWMEKACEALSLPADKPLLDGEWSRVSEKAKELEFEWSTSDDCESGYADCYRMEGLKFLEAVGYRVIQAI